LLCIPVINEKSNLAVLLPEIFSLLPDGHILIVDDVSTDGTSGLIEDLKLKSGYSITHDYSMVRRGIGNAHIVGMSFAKKNGFEYLVTMDGDLTHNPDHIADLMRVLEGNPTVDLVIGSRFLESGRLQNWTLLRKFMTHGGHLLTRLFLGMKEDCSSGFRAYRVELLPIEILNDFKLKGYDFFFKSAYIFKHSDKNILETSVKLKARHAGHSKMTLVDVLNGVGGILMFRLKFLKYKRFNKARTLKLKTGDSHHE
jgi:dolichol-phosphate mannosyltransferase